MRRRDGELHYFEAKVEHATPKAMLVEMTLGGKYWVPRSQIREQGQPDEDGNIEFAVTDWWWGVKTPVDGD